MVFRVPPRKAPQRVTLAGALRHILAQVYEPSADGQGALDASLHFAMIRVMSFQHLPEGSLRDMAPGPVPGFMLDPIDVATVILEAIQDGSLSVEDLPEPYLSNWRKRPSVYWDSGVVIFGLGFTYGRQEFRPTLSVAELESLFSEPDERSVCDAPAKNDAHVQPQAIRNRRTGPAPDKHQAIKERILCAIRAGRTLTNEKQEALTEEFGNGASRTTVMKAFDKALSELNSDKK